MTAIRITPKQKLFLEFLAQFEAQHGYAPSQHEIAAHFGFKSLGTVQDYLKRLEDLGAIRKDWNARRGTSLAPKTVAQLKTTTTSGAVSGTWTVPSPTIFTLPLEGRVAAGRPIEAITQNRTVEIPATLIPARFQSQCYALQVVGDSMIGEGIFEDDFVIIKRQDHAENGQTVVALLEGQAATIKKFYRRSHRIELHSANPKYRPILIEEDPEFRVAGILIALFRKF